MEFPELVAERSSVRMSKNFISLHKEKILHLKFQEIYLK